MTRCDIVQHMSSIRQHILLDGHGFRYCVQTVINIKCTDGV